MVPINAGFHGQDLTLVRKVGADGSVESKKLGEVLFVPLVEKGS